MAELTKEKSEKSTIDRKDFMKQMGIGFGAIMLMNCLQSCSEGEIPDPNPNPGGSTGVDFTLDLNAAANSSLKTQGGFLVVSSRNIIVARTLNDTFIAVSSSCTHQGTTVNYRANTNDFRCPNHGSEFSNTGAVTNGPATSALKKYNTSFDETANTIRIFS
ncbi:QcrA and Rieske domain-containing protein [Jiulongibacter sediminis]|uniref:QcrA and Rieske domain-containing protein n=1 Tax=Jiulongibacter sediminis TaxID=1605367 RepID=UPI0006DCC932|nr:Rieske (2Fe-2S) protein [Jiulongibacter sediminis]